MTKLINLTEARNHLDELISSVSQGDEVIITTDTYPVVRMESFMGMKRERIADLGKDNIIWISDDFDDPLPDEFWLGNDEFWLGTDKEKNLEE